MKIRLGIWTILATAAFGQTPAPPAPPSPPRARSVATISNRPAYLGISTMDIDSERASALKLKDVRGAEVKSVVDDSPASKAGFKEGDVILEFNGQPVEGGAQLTRMVRETPVGRTVKVGIWRNGAAMSLNATLEPGKGMVIDGGSTWVMPEVRMPEIRIPDIPVIEMPRMELSYDNAMLGISAEALSRDGQLAEFFGVKEGVLVKSVNHNSAAEKAGIKAGDIIVKIEDNHIVTSRDITAALRANRSKKTVTVTVVRNKKETPLTVNVEMGLNAPNVKALVIAPRVHFVSPALKRAIVVLRPQNVI